MKHLILTVCALGLAMGVANAQQSGPGPGGQPPYAPPPPPIMLPPELIDQLPVEVVSLLEEVKTLRDGLRDSRAELLTGLEGATREEIVAAITAWREANADAIALVQEKTKELRDLIQEYRPVVPRPPVPEEILALREQLKDDRQDLADSRKAAIDALGEDPTPEAIRDAVAAWRVDNADEIAAVRALAEELRQWFRDNRPGRPVPVVTEAMVQRRAAFQDTAQAMRENRTGLRTKLQDRSLSEEQRQAIMQQFREEQRNLIMEQRALMRQQRIEQGAVGGDRRPGG